MAPGGAWASPGLPIAMTGAKRAACITSAISGVVDPPDLLRGCEEKASKEKERRKRIGGCLAASTARDAFRPNSQSVVNRRLNGSPIKNLQTSSSTAAPTNRRPI